MRFFACLTIGILLGSCLSGSLNKFDDPGLIVIADLQDKRNTDSLLHYLIHTNHVYRAEAALALASVQDTTAAIPLGSALLEDPYIPVRIHAAFALGQTRGYAAVNALIPALSDTSSAVISEVLQALGKSLTQYDLDALTNFQPKDSLQFYGQAWGFYYSGMRGLHNPAMIKKATQFLLSEYGSVRLAAAHFFNRANGLKGIPENELLACALSDSHVNVRIASVAALRKGSSPEVVAALKKILQADPDYRVRTNAARTAAQFLKGQAEELILLALKDENEWVRVSAAESLQDGFTRLDELLAAARQSENIRVKAALYKLLLPLRPDLSTEIQNLYRQSDNPYAKAFYLSAFAGDVSSHSFISEQLIQSPVPVIKTTSAQVLVNMNRNKSFSESLKPAFARYYQQAIENGDTGVISIIASVLADSTQNYKVLIPDFQFLQAAKNKLQLPKDYEALQPLEEAIAYFEGREKPPPPENQFNHPIDWPLVKSIPKNQRVKITTNKGDIVLRLLMEEAPGSVANFVQLINQKYFDGKFIHRVVPNFVIQTGCYRGDGYGSEAYSIRSEFSLRRYTTGSVGMASAGKDTEGTQWFITHSPTPHLNGRYTLFAEVESGMEVVHQLEVGDTINSIQLMENK
jgi:cyclophilin family peptidyl-prolyl cis-trans isomerase/HEAT repeat protein